MVYLDTSALVALFTNEAATPNMVSWYQRQRLGSVSVSDWCVTEYSSALSQKRRRSFLDSEEQSQALAAFRTACEDSFHILPVLHDDFVKAAIFANQSGLGLRAGDALHLAIAYGAALPIVTFDKKLAAAAVQVGVAVIEV